MIDLRKNNGELRETKSAMRRHHDEEIVRMEREHEEKILFLLRQLANKDPAESNDISLNKDISDVEEVIKFQVRINFLYLHLEFILINRVPWRCYFTFVFRYKHNV